MYVAASAMASDESRSEVVVVNATSVPLSKYYRQHEVTGRSDGFAMHSLCRHSGADGSLLLQLSDLIMAILIGV